MKNSNTVITISTFFTFALLLLCVGTDVARAERLASSSSSSTSIAKTSSSTSVPSSTINYCPVGFHASSTSTSILHASSATSASAKKRGHSSSTTASDSKATNSSHSHKHTVTVSCVPRPSGMQTASSSPITAIVNATGVSASQAMTAAQSGASSTIPQSLTILFTLVATFFWTSL